MQNLLDVVLPIVEQIRAGDKTIAVSELWGASKALFLFGLRQVTLRPVIIVTASEQETERIAEDLKFFAKALQDETTEPGPDISSFPAWGLLPFEADSADSRTIGARMRFLYRLTSGLPGIYLVPIRSLIQKLPPWELFADSIKTVTAGTEAEPDRFVESLVATGYESSNLVTRVGEFSRRGGIIDLFSPYHENPVRIELFGDTIESLREFDPETQRSIRDIKQSVTLPVRELIVTEQGINAFEQRLKPGADDEISARDELARGRKILAQIKQGLLPPGADFLAPFFYDMESLFQYVPDDAVFAQIEPDDIEREIITFGEKIEQGRREEIEGGRMLPDSPAFYLGKDEIAEAIQKFPNVNISLLNTGTAHRMDTKSASWLGVRLTRPIEPRAGENEARPVEGTMAGLIEKLKRIRDYARVAIVCGTGDSAARLKDLFLEYGLGAALVTRLTGGQPALLPVMVLIGRLSEGFSWQNLGVTFITEEEIFGKKIHPSAGSAARPSKASPFLSTFKELKPGDFVVHTDYGVGEYQGLTHISVDGYETDFLTLRYEPDVKLHVPLYTLEKVQKYIGAEGAAPKLDRLGAPAWARTKEKAKKDILAMARELIAIYAAREAMQRPVFNPPDNLFREFESSFPFEETEGQQKAIEDVLADMRRPRPMDRLVCGDVGYGKTEVALRAAFKAVEDGLQVAVLVPTTLLADQHCRTFKERLAPFSIRVEMLSRFRTRAEQQETLKGLKSGVVDVVIGTHRLLQRDIFIKNLGLLVVDEEHKFGVKHKERIKDFKKLVDVLTLTATPIPRTLHMSLSGIRDLSIIQTPPLDRQAIQVVLARFGKRIIREAIMHELDRGGQVFFLHNRVQGIERMADFVRSLVPGATVGIAHGQLAENEIENVMSEFVNGKLKVLVTTTIIESGIDIPNANTIIINRADRFGLADLYQIKGRVGRGREKAFAYLLAPAEETLSDIARKRLRAIQELSELGAGFRIAAQDLETRGAGNLLGKQQSGHIAAVGIDLYTQMMEEAMAELRGEEPLRQADTIISMAASAFIPEAYINDPSLRLAAYKEISSASDEVQLREIAEELRDRYGILPEPAANLFDIMSVKLVARAAMVSRVDAAGRQVHITFAEDARISPDRIMLLLKKNKGAVKLVSEYSMQVTVADSSLRTASEAVKKCLQELV